MRRHLYKLLLPAALALLTACQATGMMLRPSVEGPLPAVYGSSAVSTITAPTSPAFNVFAGETCANDPVNLTDSQGTWVGLDDAAALGLGAIGGLAIQGIGDLYSGKLSSWQHYVAAAVGGAAAGEATLYTGPGGGLLARTAVSASVGGLIGNVTRQDLDIVTGQQTDFNYASMAGETALSGAFGLGGGAVAKFAPGAMRYVANAARERGFMPNFGSRAGRVYVPGLKNAAAAERTVYNVADDFEAIATSRRVWGQTEGSVYGMRQANAPRWRTMADTPVRDPGTIIFEDEAAKLFKPHPFEGPYSGMKRLFGQQKAGFGDIALDNFTRSGNTLRVTSAHLVPHAGQSTAWASARLWGRRLVIEPAATATVGIGLYYGYNALNGGK